ncbi:hypothetical protein [Sphingomonas sp. PAMC 26605]|uniref:hypothetical protein n=1 Tax=Sphingomonas sp. PAMC 26605 TaxID=1112214 RepID=UPI0002E08EFF|nr:hypothetical protein [Sphingomonas sp. PAMC 26605]
MTPPKPDRQTCEHCSADGCSIYDARPDACRGFQCLWLASQQIAQLALPAAMRPDRAGIVIDLNAAGTVLAHCEHPGSWTREPMRSWLLDKAARTNVILELSYGAEMLAADGGTERLERVGVHESGNRLYVRVSDLPKWKAQAAA